MDNKDKPNREDGEEIAKEEIVTESVKITIATSPNDAGPSTILPGAVPDMKLNFQSKTGLSKSEHNLRHIITSKDVEIALKSLNIPTNQKQSEFNRMINKDVKQDAEPTTFVDLKKFMATCFKMNKDTHSGILLGEVQAPVNVQAAPVITADAVQEGLEIPNTSTVCSNKTNEVVVTGVDEKVSRNSAEREKKKTSANASERSDLGLAQRDSLSSIGSNVCRICMTRGRERLISPCNCKGSLANVHLSCLERWLNQVGRNHCELCGYSYPAIRTPRYTVLQALRLWFGNPRNRSHLQSDCLIFWLLSTVTAGLLAVCIVGTQYFVIEGNKFGKLDPALRKEEGATIKRYHTSFPGISHRITETAMDFFMAIVLCGYSVTVYLLWKDHYVMWNRWRRANVNVRLLLSPDTNPVPFTPRPRYNIV